jgi:hypothetical protein
MRRGGVALAAGAASAVLVYALLRLVQRLVLTEPDPTEVFYSEHAGFFWRAWTSVYAAGMVTLVVWLAGARRPDVAARLASTLVLAGAVAIAVVGVVAP